MVHLLKTNKLLFLAINNATVLLQCCYFGGNIMLPPAMLQ
jgi:hypothetical protein